MLLYPVSKRLGWNAPITMMVGAFVSFVLFISVSSLLYLDILRWSIPGIMDQPGSTWMFHTDITGVAKSQVPLPLVIGLFAFYPLWIHLGYHSSRHIFTKQMLLTPLVFNADDMHSRSRRQPLDHAVTRNKDERRAVREAVDQLGGMTKFVQKGDRVMIKVNISGGNPQIAGSFTNINVTDEVLKMVREAGGDPFICDSDMIWTEFDSVARDEGYIEWAKKVNVPLINLVRTRCAYFEFPEDSLIGSTIVSLETINADVIISIPTMKTHLLTTVTLGMKNMYGAFPEKDKAKYHTAGIEDVVFEVARAFTPTLTIVDGSIGGEAYGPLSSSPVNFQTIVASTDVVAADSLSAQLMGYNPLEIVHIRKAHEAGVGRADVKLDFSKLPYAHPKDGKWEKPSPEASLFYDELLEASLMFPGVQDFFNLVADFFLFGTATLPVLEHLTPQAERVINDIATSLVRSNKITLGATGKIISDLQKAGAKIRVA